jgi:hypothetical protein
MLVDYLRTCPNLVPSDGRGDARLEPRNSHNQLWELTNLQELAKIWRCVGENLRCPKLTMGEGARVPKAMSSQHAHYEPFAWWLTRQGIGQDLRERNPALQELPPRRR